jgi:hypothetical protein
MGLISSHYMTPDQLRRCCRNNLSAEVIGYALHTIDGKRVGTVEDILVDDETLDVRYLVVNASTAEFTLNQPYVLLTPDLCCWDAAQRLVRSQATAQEVQDAPAFDRAVDLVQAYEETAILNYGERPFAPADH